MLIITSAYTANLASFLVMRNTKYGEITSIEQAVLKKAPVCLVGSTNMDTYFTTNYPKATLVRKEDTLAMFDAVKSGECYVALVGKNAFDGYIRDSEVNKSLFWILSTMV